MMFKIAQTWTKPKGPLMNGFKNVEYINNEILFSPIEFLGNTHTYTHAHDPTIYKKPTKLFQLQKKLCIENKLEGNSPKSICLSLMEPCKIYLLS